MGAIILIVEDEPAIADTITYALATDGFTPQWCATGAAALQVFGQNDVALVILDVGLPDVNGFELFKQLQALAPVPVIFLTARSAEIDRVVGLELGADDYVAKPFSPRELTARVRSVLRRSQRLPLTPKEATHAVSNGIEHTASAAPFRVDDECKTVHYMGVKLELSRYEFRVLKILVERPGRVYTRPELMELAWDAPDHSLDRTVDAHVKSLRNKLRCVTPQTDPIKTHRGLGYSLKHDW